MGMIYVGHYKHCFILNIHALGFVVSEKKIVSCFSYYKPLVDTDARSVGGIWT